MDAGLRRLAGTKTGRAAVLSQTPAAALAAINQFFHHRCQRLVCPSGAGLTRWLDAHWHLFGDPKNRRGSHRRPSPVDDGK